MTDRTVPVSHALGVGTVGQLKEQRDRVRDKGGTMGLKELARRSFQRDRRRDTGGTLVPAAVPAPGPALGHAELGVQLGEQRRRQDDFAERAALVEEGSGVPRAWAEGLARLVTADRLRGFTAEQWRCLIDDGAKFLDRWANRAADFGWSAIDAFGVVPAVDGQSRSLPQVGQRTGLVTLIGGGDVVSIAEGRATIRYSSGSELTYLRRAGPGAVAVWELIA